MLFRELRVAITGASSFTAFWAARAFSAQGARVTALCKRGSLEAYDGLKRKRLELLSSQVDLHFGVKGEDGSMAFWIETHRPDVWIHHHHSMENYKTPSYDMVRADRVGVDPLKEIFASLKKSGAKGVIFSGSYMEPGEGGTKNPANASPFAVSSQRTWEAVQERCREFEFPLGKVVIPNPIGPLENEDRIVPLLMKNAKAKTPFHVANAESIVDCLPVKTLASVYLESCSDVLRRESRVRRPSGWVTSVKGLIETVNRELLMKRLNMGLCETLLVTPQEPKIAFTNIATERQRFDMSAFWDEYAKFIRSGEVIRDVAL